VWRELNGWRYWEQLPGTDLIRMRRSGHYLGADMVRTFDEVNKDGVTGPLTEVDADYQPLQRGDNS
jgi:hypothetical protein